MGLHRGTVTPDAVYRGAVAVEAVYRGASRVWPEGVAFNGKKNDFSGIAAGTPVTPANSATGGDAFDTIETSNATVLARAGGVGVQLGGGNAYGFPEWLVPSSQEGRVRWYFTTLPANPTAIIRQMEVRNGGSIRAQARMETNRRITLTDPGGGWIEQTSTALNTSTAYRVEVEIRAARGDCHLYVYEGDSLTPLGIDVHGPGSAPGTFDRVGIGYIGGGSVNSAEIQLAKYAWTPDPSNVIGPE